MLLLVLLPIVVAKKTLKQFGLKIQHVAELCSQNSGHFKLQKMLQNSTGLMGLGFSMAYILKSVHLSGLK